MSSRLPIRARVLWRSNLWLVVLPTGRRVTFIGDHWGWILAMRYANEAVRKEREYARLKSLHSETREYHVRDDPGYFTGRFPNIR